MHDAKFGVRISWMNENRIGRRPDGIPLFLVIPPDLDQPSKYMTGKPNIHPGRAIDPARLNSCDGFIRDSVHH